MEVRSNCYQDDVTLWVELGGCQLCCHVEVCLTPLLKSEGYNRGLRSRHEVEGRVMRRERPVQSRDPHRGQALTASICGYTYNIHLYLQHAYTSSIKFNLKSAGRLIYR